jgi:hypothetical protein
MSVEDFLHQLQTFKPARCDAPALRILGLSFAGWNAIISAGLAALAVAGARSRAKGSCVYPLLGAKARNKQCESWRGGPRMTVLATSGRRSDHASGPDAAKATGPGIPTMINCRACGDSLRQLIGLNASADI